MKPKTNKFFIVDDPDLNDVVLFLLGKERRGLLDEKDWANPRQADSKYKQLVDRTRYLLNVNFTPLQQPRYRTMNSRSKFLRIESIKLMPVHFVTEERLAC
jgi:hypothetical protein